MILNLPATVEMSTPNVYADQIEWFGRHVPRRDSRDPQPAPAQRPRHAPSPPPSSALMAGGERVEGTLFGNGERTGNVDIVTLALNLLTPGRRPAARLLATSTRPAASSRTATELPVHHAPPVRGRARLHGLLGLAPGRDQEGHGGARSARRARLWEVPYLPIDPKDVGRTYEAIIRVNSQSGQGRRRLRDEARARLDLPRGMQIEFARSSRRSPRAAAAS